MTEGRIRRWLSSEGSRRCAAGEVARYPVPILACENFGPMSAPRLPQTLQTNFNVRQANVIGPAVGVGLDVVAAAVVAQIDQHVVDAGGAHFAEGDLDGRVGVHDTPDDVPGRQLRPEILTRSQALEQAKALARAEQDKDLPTAARC